MPTKESKGAGRTRILRKNTSARRKGAPAPRISRVGPQSMQRDHADDDVIGIALPEKFETFAASRKEDKTRLERLYWSTPIIGPVGWTNMIPVLKRSAQRIPHLREPALDRAACLALKAKLSSAVEGGPTVPTLASSVYMRGLRAELLEHLREAFEDYPDASLRHVTVVKPTWSYSPEELDAVTAKTIRNQFLADLKVQTDVAYHPDPLVAFLHSEFEPTSGKYVLHWHVLTTKAKAELLKASLGKLKLYKGKTATKGRAIRISKIGDRARQFTYLLKAYWAQKTFREKTGKRDRIQRRIAEPFGTQVLLWLDRQRLRDMTIMNKCWSPRDRGSEAMRKLYLLIGRGG